MKAAGKDDWKGRVRFISDESSFPCRLTLQRHFMILPTKRPKYCPPIGKQARTCKDINHKPFGVACFIRHCSRIKRPNHGQLPGVVHPVTHRLFPNSSGYVPCTTFPAPPLKFRTLGFPLYGFKLEFSCDLRWTPPRFKYEAYMHPEDANLYATKAENLCPCGPKGHDSGTRYFQRSSPEALDSPLRYVVAMGHRLLWPHPRLSALTYALFSSSIVTLPYGLVWAGTERFPNLIHISFTSCHLPYPDDSSRCSWLLLPY